MRRPNFTEEELFVLIKEVGARKDIIVSKLGGRVTAECKKYAWDCIASAVNAVGNVVREREEVRKKYVDFRSLVKKRAAALKRERSLTVCSTDHLILNCLARYPAVPTFPFIGAPTPIYATFLIVEISVQHTHSAKGYAPNGGPLERPAGEP
ncbi:Myb/SANT-like DNA-binding domain-containing protein 4 [Chionoecetes opilio]|uniref:Regulatory protein zeste n=1 Tax=Chionoecetes opilio TaxID=41210 RepID=A0A8J5D3J1_CHIOP|nr:Myb/SANT-like DNA-binding domain-containing protein 4 [Chionoecetes opilio]